MMIFMLYNIKESVKIHLETEIGYYILTELYEDNEFNVIDCFDICKQFIPANYIISRENYIFS